MNLIRIYRSLGGGWQIRLGQDVGTLAFATTDGQIDQPEAIEFDIPIP